jgi:hypothetical protein
MTQEQTIQTLRRFNAWRRGEETLEQPSPAIAGQAIDRIIEICEEWEMKYEVAIDMAARAEIQRDAFKDALNKLIWAFQINFDEGKINADKGAFDQFLDQWTSITKEIDNLGNDE